MMVDELVDLIRRPNVDANHFPDAALLAVRIRTLFWPLVIAFNLVGAVDILVDYYQAIQVGLPALAGQLGAGYAIPIIYVPVLMITHVAAFYLLLRPQPKAVRAIAGATAASKAV